MKTKSVATRQSVALGEGFELDLRPRQLRRGDRTFKLERIPIEILFLLAERPGEIVTREEIVARVWGPDVFLDTDNSIRTAIRKIRQALKDDADSPRFIETVTGRGYRFMPPAAKSGHKSDKDETPPSTALTGSQMFGLETPVGLSGKGDYTAETGQAHTEGRPETDPKGTNGKKSELATRWLFAGLAALAVSLLSVVGIGRWRSVSVARPASDRRMVLAVLPFENLGGDADQEFFSDGLTEQMIAEMGRLNRERLTVIARNSVTRYKGTVLTAKEIGSELNADYLVEGSVQRSIDRVRVRVELIDARGQTDLWTGSYDSELKDMLAVQDSIVSGVANEIHIALSAEQRTRLANFRETVPESYVAYLKGRYYWNKRTGQSIAKAEQYFQQAIDSNPSFAAAYSGLADCNSGLAWHGFKAPEDALPKAEAAARKAIEIDPTSAEAHASLGLVLSHRWRWAESESEFKRAIELEPQYANAHHWYGDLLSMEGRHEEAVSEAKGALALDPLNLMISTWVGLRFYLARKYPAAVAQNRDSVELDPHFAGAHLLLGLDCIQVGLHSEAVSELKTAAKLSGDSTLYSAEVGVALATAGRKDAALRIASGLVSASKKRYVSPYGLAQIYASVGRDQEAFKWLEAASVDHSVWMGYIGVDPVFDRYRSDARFRELLGQVNLPGTSVLNTSSQPKLLSLTH